MRILSGDLYGQTFGQPKTEGTRPLTEKVRAAIFDVIGAPEGLTVLDVYAGSGAAGFEALSRGAEQIEAIESNRQVAHAIERNVAKLGVGSRYVLRAMKLETWLAQPDQNPPSPRYDIIVADPPYADLDAGLLGRLGGFLRTGGVMVVSHSSKLQPPQFAGLTLAKTKLYGDSALTFYQSVGS